MRTTKPKMSRAVPLLLLGGIAFCMTACGNDRRCVDVNNTIVDGANCEQAYRSGSGSHFWYYGGTTLGGRTASGGSYNPPGGRAGAAIGGGSSSGGGASEAGGVSRGGLGSTAASHGSASSGS